MYAVNHGCKSLPPCCLTSLFVAGRTRLRYMPLTMLTMKNKFHDFLFPCLHVVFFQQSWCTALQPYGPPELRYSCCDKFISEVVFKIKSSATRNVIGVNAKDIESQMPQGANDQRLHSYNISN